MLFGRIGFVIISFATTVYGYRILGVFSALMKSHYHFGHALMKGLANDGHQVTMVTAYARNHSIPNYEEILIEDVLDVYKKGKVK